MTRYVLTEIRSGVRVDTADFDWWRPKHGPIDALLIPDEDAGACDFTYIAYSARPPEATEGYEVYEIHPGGGREYVGFVVRKLEPDD